MLGCKGYGSIFSNLEKKIDLSMIFNKVQEDQSTTQTPDKAAVGFPQNLIPTKILNLDDRSRRRLDNLVLLIDQGLVEFFEGYLGNCETEDLMVRVVEVLISSFEIVALSNLIAHLLPSNIMNEKAGESTIKDSEILEDINEPMAENTGTPADMVEIIRLCESLGTTRDSQYSSLDAYSPFSHIVLVARRCEELNLDFLEKVKEISNASSAAASSADKSNALKKAIRDFVSPPSGSGLLLAPGHRASTIEF